MRPMRISIVLPTLDEGPLLRQTVESSLKHLPDHAVRFIIPTSATLTTPQTRAVLEGLATQYDFIDTFDQAQAGVGMAIREAFARAEGDAVVIMTADLETPPEALPAMMEKLAAGYDVVATTRWRRGIKLNGYHPIKFLLNFLFQQFFRMLYFTRLSDLTYGYRAFRTPVVKEIAWEEARHPFFFETILKPLRLGYSIAEVEVPWEMFISRKTSTGRAKPKDLLAYIRVGLRNHVLPTSRMRRQ
jgi:glycosyltransferase involved in cell wall biosynthesis